MTQIPRFEDVIAAAERIGPYVHRTPVLTSRTLNQMAGAELFMKDEGLQRVGAFKARGACNAVFALTEEQARRGVATHSSGNHGAALAYAAGLRGVPAIVVMPENAPRSNGRRWRGTGRGSSSAGPGRSIGSRSWRT
jgi:threonine dehydratase